MSDRWHANCNGNGMVSFMHSLLMSLSESGLFLSQSVSAKLSRRMFARFILNFFNFSCDIFDGPKVITYSNRFTVEVTSLAIWYILIIKSNLLLNKIFIFYFPV